VKSRAVALALGVTVAVLATPPVSRAQPAPRVPRTGLLCATRCSPMMGGFEQGLRELPYIDGQNIVVDLRGAGAADDQLPRAAAELILNLTTAKALGLTIPDSLLVRADQVIR
jgi:hypothetical protein